MKRAAGFAAILVCAAAILGLIEARFHVLRNLSGGLPLGQRELATRFLGQYLARQFPGKKALVLSNPFSQQPGQPKEIYQFETAGVRGLREGLGTAVPIEAVVFPELRPGFLQNPHGVFIDHATTTPLSYVVAEDALDKLAQQHRDAEVIISLIGLPLNVLQTRTWKADSGRSFGLLLPDLRMIGSQEEIRQAIHSGKIAAIIFNKPGAPSEDQPLGRDLKMEFDQRFLLITPETVDRYLQVYPKLF